MRLVLFLCFVFWTTTLAFSPAAVSIHGRSVATPSHSALHSSIAANDMMLETNTARAFSQRSSMSLSSLAVMERVRDAMIQPSPRVSVASNQATRTQDSKYTASNLYVQFARRYPFLNNLLIATFKSGAADFMAQTVIGGAALRKLDLSRSILFMLFGAIYSGAFQWLYQVRIFQKLFDVNKFTQQSWAKKLRDRAGLQSLAAQTALDLGVLTAVYLPTFYIFKASVFSGSLDPIDWIQTGFTQYRTHLVKDALDVVRVWLPADLICFSVPMYLRLPVRHSVAFLWTAYLSFTRGGH